MDEQMIAIERVMDLLRTVGPDDVLIAPFKAKATYGDLRVVVAAHSVIAGKVAELTELLREAAPFVGWVSTRPHRIMAGVDADELCDRIDAALAPYPERR